MLIVAGLSCVPVRSAEQAGAGGEGSLKVTVLLAQSRSAHVSGVSCGCQQGGQHTWNASGQVALEGDGAALDLWVRGKG
jgi:hypothetical protein